MEPTSVNDMAADVLQKVNDKDVAHLEAGFDRWKQGGGAWEEVSVPEDLWKG